MEQVQDETAITTSLKDSSTASPADVQPVAAAAAVAASASASATGADATDATDTIALGSFHAGCAGFANPNWVGPYNFYSSNRVGNDSERQLDEYQQYFDSVEINATFYGHPTDATLEKWKRHAAPGFQFILKAKKTITHDNNHTLVISELAIFLRQAVKLGVDHLAIVLIQCPMSLDVTVSQLEEVLECLQDTFYRGKLALEFRNPKTYRDARIYEFVKQQPKWTLVYHPNSVGRTTIGTTQTGREVPDFTNTSSRYVLEDLATMARAVPPTTDFVYIRLHGARDDHAHDYTSKELDRVAQQIHDWRALGLHVWVYFLNDLPPHHATTPTTKQSSSSTGTPTKVPAKKALFTFKDAWCAMPRNVQQLKEKVYVLAKETNPPLAPKQPRHTIQSLFQKQQKQQQKQQSPSTHKPSFAGQAPKPTPPPTNRKRAAPSTAPNSSNKKPNVTIASFFPKKDVI
jgi:uncharacterized protein YecE (DUF72 family)